MIEVKENQTELIAKMVEKLEGFLGLHVKI